MKTLILINYIKQFAKIYICYYDVLSELGRFPTAVIGWKCKYQKFIIIPSVNWIDEYVNQFKLYEQYFMVPSFKINLRQLGFGFMLNTPQFTRDIAYMVTKKTWKLMITRMKWYIRFTAQMEFFIMGYSESINFSTKMYVNHNIPLYCVVHCITHCV